MNYDQENHISYQLTPPNVHRANSSERAIRVWKDHFIYGLCTTANEFPVFLWYILIDQCNLTLNILRASNRNPNISAFEEIEGSFDYNKKPLAPPGCKVLVHEKNDKRTTWGAKETEVWYIGPAPHHYRCSKVFISATRSEIITDKLQFLPNTSYLPELSHQEELIHATEDLTKAILHQKKSVKNSPSYKSTLEAINRLMKLLPHNNADTINNNEKWKIIKIDRRKILNNILVTVIILRG